MGEARESGWCILRTSGRNTLPLAEALAEAGFEAWAPSEAKRAPRTKCVRMVAMMPTFVFAGADRLEELCRLADSPAQDVPFSVFRYLDKIPLIADAELAGLRRAERRGEVDAFGADFGPGDVVRATEGPYTGHSGTVARVKGDWSLVLFGWQRVKISTFVLQPIPLDNRSAAKAA